MDKRINTVTATLGRRNSGKTYLTLQLIDAYMKNRADMKILVVDTLDHPHYNLVANIEIDMLKHWKKHSIYRIYGYDMKMIMAAIEENLANTLIIFEDASKYVDKLMDKHIKRIIFDSKQKNNDIIFLFHGFMSTPPELFRLLDLLTIFKTGDHPKTRKNDMVNYEEVLAAYNEIMKSKNEHIHKSIKIY